MSSYNIVKNGGDAVIEVKRSKFIAAVYPVNSEEEALRFLNTVQRKYYDAKHHCSAYIIAGEDESSQDTVHSSDDGEPSGTAGQPILSVINGAGLKNVICVVTRYFGGVLLGTGGLVRAYTDAAKAAVENAVIAEVALKQIFKISFDYPLTGKVDYILENAGCVKENTEYTDRVSYICSVKADEAVNLFDKLTEATSAGVMIEALTKKYI
ncbi:MAG: YigZ family protein [Lachnospiraceae bacterium]|nr:YigZ family protein [Lachnospiraceae bacterium]